MTYAQSENTVFHCVGQALKALGNTGTIKALKDAIQKKYSNDHAFHILVMVSDKVGISIEELQRPNLRSDKRKVALGIIIHILTTEFDHSYTDISVNLKLSFSRKTIKEYHDLIKDAKLKTPKSDIDKLIALHYFELTESAIKYKKTLTNGTN